MQVHVEPRANQDQPVAFDLVAVRDKAVHAQLLGITASQWFEKKDQIRNDYPERKDLEIWSWEWVPGQQVGAVTVRPDNRPRSTFVFARYASPGDNRARLDPHAVNGIVLGEREMSLQTSSSRTPRLR